MSRSQFNAVGALQVALSIVAILVAACSDAHDVTSPPDHYLRAQYQLVDLTAAAPSAAFSWLEQDGAVAGNRSGGGFVWRASGITPLTGCTHLYAINTTGAALCDTNAGLSILENGVVTPVRGLPAGAQLYPPNINSAGVISGEFFATSCGLCIYTIVDGDFNRIDRPGYSEGLWINSEGDSLFAGSHGANYRSPYLLGRANGSQLEFDTGGEGWAYSMNDSGWVAGGYADHLGGSGAFVVTPSGSIDLGGAGAGLSVNNLGDVVAMFTGDPKINFPATGPELVGPALWSHGVARLLIHATIDSSWVITAVSQINDQGQILATADDSSSRSFKRTVLLTPAR